MLLVAKKRRVKRVRSELCRLDGCSSVTQSIQRLRSDQTRDRQISTPSSASGSSQRAAPPVPGLSGSHGDPGRLAVMDTARTFVVIRVTKLSASLYHNPFQQYHQKRPTSRTPKREYHQKTQLQLGIRLLLCGLVDPFLKSGALCWA